MTQLDIPGYRIERRLGQGGMGSVYLAVQESLDRRVALKVLERAESAALTDRLVNEGRLIASLSHRNIVVVHDVGVVQGHLYVSMEYVEGGNLRSRIKAGMSAEEALEIVAAIGDALELAHENGVIHRDVKPANILFRRDGTPLLADFGIAKAFERDPGLTDEGKVVGSPHYLSPEQAGSQPIDGRADLYALGVILYEMLTGERPFDGQSAVQVVFKHVNESPPRLAPAQAPFQPLLDRLLAKRPEERFASAAELLTAVTELRVRRVVDRFAPPAPSRSGAGAALGRHLRASAVGLALLVAAGGLYVKRDTMVAGVVHYMEAATNSQLLDDLLELAYHLSR